MTKMTKALRTQLADVNAQLSAPAPQAQAQYTERFINTYTKRDGSRWGVYQTARPLAA